MSRQHQPRRRRPTALATLLALVLALAASPAQAAAPVLIHNERNVILGAGGDVEFPPEEHASFVVVVGGRAHVHGRIETLLVVRGDALLDGADVRDLTVVGGRAELRRTTVVSGNVLLVGAELERDPGVQVLGTITHDRLPRWGSFPFGLLFALGASLAVVVAGLAFLALAPTTVARAVALLGERSGSTLVAATLAWVGGPLVALICMFSLVGLPVGVGLLVLVLPVLAMLGFLVAGQATGVRLLELLHVREPGRAPFSTMTLGLVTLMALGALPIVGAFLGLLAAFLGSGALVRLGWNAFRARGRAAPHAATSHAADAAPSA